MESADAWHLRFDAMMEDREVESHVELCDYLFWSQGISKQLRITGIN